MRLFLALLPLIALACDRAQTSQQSAPATSPPSEVRLGYFANVAHAQAVLGVSSGDFASAVYQTQQRGGGLSVARFAFDPAHSRAQIDGARIISRLMRQMDFGAAQKDGSVIVVFAETDFRTAHMIARRLSAVMRHTSNGKHEMRSDPVVSVDSLSPSDTARSLLARLSADASRAAS